MQPLKSFSAAAASKMVLVAHGHADGAFAHRKTAPPDCFFLAVRQLRPMRALPLPGRHHCGLMVRKSHSADLSLRPNPASRRFFCS